MQIESKKQRPAFVSWLAALAGAVAPLLAQAQAVPIAVGVEGLPADLRVTLVAHRNNCPDGQGSTQVGRVLATESQRVVYDFVQTINGPTLRARTINRYTAQFNIAPPSNPCPPLFGAPDLRFSAEVLGITPQNTLASRTAAVGSAFLTGAAQNLVFALSANSEQPHVGNFTFIPPWQRGLMNVITVKHKNPFGPQSTQRPTLEFRKPGLIVGQPDVLVARVFIRADNRDCVQTSAQQLCVGDPGAQATSATLAGVTIHSNSMHPNFTDAESTDFMITLSSTAFAAGTYKLRAFADDRDAIEYLVNGSFEALDLLPWTAFNGNVIVQ